MICPNCQSDNREGAKYCSECGFPLSGKIAAVAAAASPDEAASALAHADARESRADAAPESLTDDETPEEAALFERAPIPRQDELDADFESTVSADGEPAARTPGTSGPLDAASLPAIDVAGVNVDENGNAFDFGLIDDEDLDAERAADDLIPFVPRRHDEEPAARTADLSGIDECLVDASYVPPSSWRSGDTMEMPRIDGQAPAKQKEFRAPDPNEKKARKNKDQKKDKPKGRGWGKVVTIVIVCLLAMGAGAAGVTYYLELWGGKTLPEVAGLTQTDATYLLESKGFDVEVMPVKSDETEGVVLLMDPSAGTREEAGTLVVIHVAAARTIPDVVSKQRDEAMGLLEKEGFENVAVEEQKSDEHEGVVLSIEPATGEKAKADTPIKLVVAVPFTVPDVAGKNWDDAKAALEKEGYAAEASYDYSDKVEPGLATGTDPAAGSKLASGSTVKVVIAKSRGVELEEAAFSYLTNAGVIELGGTTYEIFSVDAVNYEGDETTSFTITGAAVTELDGETVHGSQKQKNGVIVWDGGDGIVSIS